MKRIYSYLPLVLFFSSSCNTLKPDLTISAKIDSRDSLLVLSIKNNTEKNFIYDFPALDESQFEKDSYMSDFYEKRGLANYLKEVDFNNEDSLNLYNCSEEIKKFDKMEMKHRFIRSKENKKYYFKILNYIQGRKLVFKAQSYNDALEVYKGTDNRYGRYNELLLLKNIKCGNYEYFTGSFEFAPKQIILP